MGPAASLAHALQITNPARFVWTGVRGGVLAVTAANAGGITGWQ